jgi:hypothetical protein
MTFPHRTAAQSTGSGSPDLHVDDARRVRVAGCGDGPCTQNGRIPDRSDGAAAL